MNPVAWIGVGLAIVTLLAVVAVAGSVWLSMSEMDDQGEETTNDHYQQ